MSQEHPYPPLELASRVGCLEGRGELLQAYEEFGAQQKGVLVGLLPEEWSFEGKRVLDFGCGAGRTLRHFLSEAEAGELWGADIDAASIDGSKKPSAHRSTSCGVRSIHLSGWSTAPSTSSGRSRSSRI